MGTTYYFLPTRNLFGEGAVKEVGELMNSLDGKKTMIVTDAFLAKSGMAAGIQEILTAAGKLEASSDPEVSSLARQIAAAAQALKE